MEWVLGWQRIPLCWIIIGLVFSTVVLELCYDLNKLEFEKYHRTLHWLGRYRFMNKINMKSLRLALWYLFLFFFKKTDFFYHTFVRRMW